MTPARFRSLRMDPWLAAALAAGLALAAAGPGWAAAPQGRRSPIVVLRAERWIDTVRGAVKNTAPVPAYDVVLHVRLRNSRHTVLGTETVELGTLQPGEEREFQVSLAEPERTAAIWEIMPRATWRPQKR